MGKAGVTPWTFVSIPRLELTVGILLEKCGKFIKRELQLEYTHETFWTSSKVVLGYIQNNTTRFKTFVANRIRQIHENCTWNNGDMYHQNLIQLTMHHAV